jgi:hypothetical protein
MSISCHEIDPFPFFIGLRRACLPESMMMRSLGSFLVPAALWIATLATSSAQEAGVEEISLRVLPLGDRAPFTQEIRDGVRHEIDPPEGSLPPREVSVGILTPKEADTKPEEKLMRLRLGEVSAAIRMPRPEQPVVTLRDQNKLWLKQGLAAAKSTLLVVWRADKTWEETRSLALDDTAEAVPRDSCRVVNVAPLEVKLIWGTQRLRLLAGKSIVLKSAEGAARTQLEILYTDASGNLRPCLSTTVEADPGNRRQWFVFHADRADARTPIQVQPLSEPR